MTPSTFRLVPYKPHFLFSRKNEGRVTTSAIEEPQQEDVCFPRFLSPLDGGTTGTAVGKKKPLTEKAKKAKRESVRHSLDGERRCCVKVCSPADVFPSFTTAT